jgi:UV DNA damage endonuclease
VPSHDTRRWQSGPHLRRSLERLGAILDYLDANDIRMYRVATALAPYASHPELTQFHGQVDECAEELAAVGQVARERDIRLSSHPGQYTVLNSEDPDVQAAAVAELEVQAALFDAMGLGPEAVVVLHVGGSAGGIAAACGRFLAGFELLSDAARRRLVLENDDRSFGTHAVAQLAERAGSRMVWDVLHHHCHDPAGMSDREAISAALATWPSGETPKIHYSSPRLDIETRTLRRGRRVEQRIVLPQLRAHADLVDPIGFERFMLDVAGERDFDVMLEAKAKDLALLRLREQVAARGLVTRTGRLRVSPALARARRGGRDGVDALS